MEKVGVALVTGGVGFIGGHLCEKLATAGFEVHSVSRREHASTLSLRHWQVDLSDFGAVSRVMKDVKPDYVFHLASHVQGSPDIKHVLPAFHGNLETTVNLLTAVAENGCRRFVTTGSFMEPVGDAGDVIPTSPYAAAKWSSTAYCRLFRAIYKLPIAT